MKLRRQLFSFQHSQFPLIPQHLNSSKARYRRPICSSISHIQNVLTGPQLIAGSRGHKTMIMSLESSMPDSLQPDKSNPNPNPQPPTPKPAKPNPDQPKPPPSKSDEYSTRSISSGLKGAVHDIHLPSVANRGPGQPGPKPQPRPDGK